jgi:hypothetical protein
VAADSASAAESADEAGASAVLLAAVVVLDEPPQAARPNAAAEAPIAFKKFRREILTFIPCSSCHFICSTNKNAFVERCWHKYTIFKSVLPLDKSAFIFKILLFSA